MNSDMWAGRETAHNRDYDYDYDYEYEFGHVGGSGDRPQQGRETAHNRSYSSPIFSGRLLFYHGSKGIEEAGQPRAYQVLQPANPHVDTGRAKHQRNGNRKAAGGSD